jgi:hypothetical protein
MVAKIPRFFGRQAGHGQIVSKFGHAEKLFQIEKHRINQWNMLLQTDYYR